VWPSALRPQHATVPLFLISQVCRLPALIVVKVPGGGLASPSLFSPQHVAVPFVLTPHVWRSPTLTPPATAPGGATAIETSVFPIGGAAAGAWAANTSRSKKTPTTIIAKN